MTEKIIDLIRIMENKVHPEQNTYLNEFKKC